MSVRRRRAAASGTPTMSRYCKSAAEALTEGPLAGLLDQARLLGRISSIVADFSLEAAASTHALPPPRCALQGRTVVITVGTASQAAKLRQRATTLQETLGERVPEITGIRIRLQLSVPAEPISGSPSSGSAGAPDAIAPSRESLSAVLRFADDLARDLHDSPLRRSAQRLQASLRAKLARGE